MIDFGKTTPIRELVPGGKITHELEWELGNYEDGYFTGMDSVIQVLLGVSFVLKFADLEKEKTDIDLFY